MVKMPLTVLGRRFVSTVRNEGVAQALRRAVRYGYRYIMGFGKGTLLRARGLRPRGPDQYLHGVWRTLAQEDAFHISATPALHQKRRQIAMIADLNLPQCRKYRVEQLAAFWRGRGVEFEYAHYQDTPRATRIMQHATHLMEYRLQNGAASDMIRYEARRLRLPILYDLDDPLFSVSAYETYGNMEALDPSLKAHFTAEAPKYLSMMNGADVLSVSTPGMAAHTALYTSRPVYLRRNFADAETLSAGHAAMVGLRRTDDLFRVVFSSGSKGHEVDLGTILPALTEFILADPRRRLRIIGHFDRKNLPKALERQVEWAKFTSYARYLDTLSAADCTILPLRNDLFNSCKSGVRVLDAAAVGVPVIVSDVGDLPAVVRHGETGCVAKTTADWLFVLRSLAQDPGAAKEMGRKARAHLEDRWQGSDQGHIIDPALIDWVEA